MPLSTFPADERTVGQASIVKGWLYVIEPDEECRWHLRLDEIAMWRFDVAKGVLAIRTRSNQTIRVRSGEDDKFGPLNELDDLLYDTLIRRAVKVDGPTTNGEPQP